MFWIIHTLVGILIALGLKNPLWIIPIAFLSHFLIDAIPHWDGFFDRIDFEKNYKVKIKKGDKIIRGADFIVSLLLVGYFTFQTYSYLIFLGAFFSLLPDIIKIGYYTKLKQNKFFINYLKFHSKIQKDTKVITGIIIQIITGIILAYFIIKLI